LHERAGQIWIFQMLADFGNLGSVKIGMPARMGKPVAKSPNQIKIVLCKRADQLHGVGQYDLRGKCT